MQSSVCTLYVYLMEIESQRIARYLIGNVCKPSRECKCSVCTLYVYLVKLKSQRNARYLIGNVCLPSIDTI